MNRFHDLTTIHILLDRWVHDGRVVEPPRDGDMEIQAHRMHKLLYDYDDLAELLCDVAQRWALQQSEPVFAALAAALHHDLTRLYVAGWPHRLWASEYLQATDISDPADSVASAAEIVLRIRRRRLVCAVRQVEARAQRYGVALPEFEPETYTPAEDRANA